MKKSKPNAAQRQLIDDWERLKKKHSVALERGAKSKGIKIVLKSKKPKIAPSSPPMDASRDLQRLPSKSTVGGVGAKKEVPQYTGTKMLGVGQMHKSNAVPIFTSEDAVDIARMRRN